MSVIIQGMEVPKGCYECRMLEGVTDDGLCHAANKWLDDDSFLWYQFPEGDIDDSKPINCPLVEVPVVQGKWIPSEDDSMVFFCSKCHEIVYGTPSYCPCCGARMDGEG
jgi:hypothetical protein